MSEVNIVTGLAADVRLPHEANFHLITPYFKHITVEQVSQSEIQKRPVHKVVEVCELRFAGDRNYSPVVPADSMYRRDGNRIITYAERWADQYMAFKTGGTQAADGTALEYLRDYGMTPSQMSILRAMKVYSIEALDALDGPNLKNLGMAANDMKAMAKKFLADRNSGVSHLSEVDALRKEIEALKRQLPASEPSNIEKDDLLAQADEEYVLAQGDDFDAMSDDQIKNYINDKVGQRPRGNPSRETLIRLAQEAKSYAAQ